MNKEEQKKLITEIMNEDAKDGLYHIVDTNKMVTAVEWLEDKLSQILDWDLIKLFKKAKAMEKKQIENAHLSGLLQPLEMEATKQAEQYYNETYKNK